MQGTTNEKEEEKNIEGRLDEGDKGREGQHTILDEAYEKRTAWSYHDGRMVLRPFV